MVRLPYKHSQNAQSTCDVTSAALAAKISMLPLSLKWTNIKENNANCQLFIDLPYPQMRSEKKTALNVVSYGNVYAVNLQHCGGRMTVVSFLFKPVRIRANYYYRTMLWSWNRCLAFLSMMAGVKFYLHCENGVSVFSRMQFVVACDIIASLIRLACEPNQAMLVLTWLSCNRRDEH